MLFRSEFKYYSFHLLVASPVTVFVIVVNLKYINSCIRASSLSGIQSDVCITGEL